MSEPTLYEAISGGNMSELTLYEAISRTARQVPERPALFFRGRTTTYRELLSLADRISAGLLGAGVRPGDVVTLCMPNLPESTAAFYAVNRMGGIAHMVHPLAPTLQLKGFLKETGSRFLFLLEGQHARHAAMLGELGVRTVLCSPAQSLGKLQRLLYRLSHPRDRVWTGECLVWKDFLGTGGEIGPAHPRDPRGTAVYLHSGGTNGSPKTVEISDFAVNSLASCGPEIIGRRDLAGYHMLAVLPMFHGFGLCMGVHTMLFLGGCDTLMPKFDPEQTVRLIEGGRIQCLIGVPALYEALLAQEGFSGEKLKKLSSAFVGGDFVPRELLGRFDRRMEEAGASVRLYEGYGLTEVVTVCAVNTQSMHRARTVGRPLAGIEMRITDPSGGELPRGEAGEILVSGPEMMNGYLNDPEGTARTLVRAEGRTWVRTGDLGSMDEEGYVTFLSRIKRIVKVSGVGVFPSEIEQIAVGFEGVRAACALGVPDERHGSMIALFLETDRGDGAELTRSLCAAIEAGLSVYAVPREIICLREMPRTAVGKADAAALQRIWENGEGRSNDGGKNQGLCALA